MITRQSGAADSSGAIIDESRIRRTVVVDPASQDPAVHRSIRDGLRAAQGHLAAGLPTRVRIAPGTYRESAMDIALGAGPGAAVLLVIEAAGPGEVRWTGADPIEGWRDEGNGLWSAPWPHELGVACDPWGLGEGVGPRREVGFIGEQPLRSVALDRFRVTGMGQFVDKPVEFSFLGNADPASAMVAGSFGVMERGPGAGRIWLRLEPGQVPTGVEVSVRGQLLNVAGKRGLVLRGLTFERTATGQRFNMYDHAVHVGGALDEGCGDVLIERCVFRWNGGSGLRIAGWRWTVRETQCDRNGLSGITGDRVRNVRFERCTTNGNCWREFISGFDGDWCFAGFKMAETSGHVVIDHQSIGNAAHGMWWDIHCTDVSVDGAVLAYNRRSFQFELSSGPFTGSRILAFAARQQPQGEGKDALDSAAVFSCAGSATLTSSIIWTATCDEVLGISWYERDSPHFRLRPLVPDLFTVERCVIAGAGRPDAVLREENVGDRTATGWRSLLYRGSGNIFWLPGRERPFVWADVAWKRRNEDLAGWQARGGEHGAQLVDPGFLDPLRGDFRVAPSSPLAKRRDLPLIRIDPALLAAARAHYRWMGWGADRFAPGSEP